MKTTSHQSKNLEPVKIARLSKKDLINYFLLFRFCGSLILAGIFGLILEYLDRKETGSSSDLIVGLGVITFINVPIQLFYLINASWFYYKQKKKKS